MSYHRNDELDPSMRCIKYLLLTFNLIFVMTGVLLICVGTTIHAIYYDFQHFLEGHFFSPSVFIMFIGVIIFCVSLFGCVGAAKESTCMIMVFTLFLTIIFIFELSAGIAGYALQGSIHDTVSENMMTIIHEYPKDEEMKKTMNILQHNLQCCGMDGKQDWQGIITSGGYPDENTNTIILPNSCCAEISTAPNFLIFHPNQTQNEIKFKCAQTNEDGCLHRLEVIIRESAVLLGGAAITVSIIEIIGIYFSFTLARAIRTAKSERERRRQEIREQLINSYSLLTNTDPQKVYPVVYMSSAVPADSTA